VLKEGTRRRSGGVVAVTYSGETGTPRVGLIVSRSAGKAVTRNRIKRRLRHALRSVNLESGNDYVIIGSAQLADAPHPQLMGWLRGALGQGE
jgi:ribonuclease P protein component